MKKLTSVLVGVFVLGGVFFAVEANAQTVGDLQLQLQALMAQVQALQAQLQQTTGVPVSPTFSPAPAVISCITVSPNLSRSSRGNEVTALQQVLRQIGAYSGPVTGFFGPLTQVAVSVFQAENSLPATGSVDAQTASAINRISCGDEHSTVTPAPPSVSVPVVIPTSSSITVLSPNGGETFTQGQQIAIRWTSSNIPTSKNVEIWLLDDPTRLGTKIFPSLANNGSVNWTVASLTQLTRPESGEIISPSGKYVIWIGCTDNSCTVDDSNAAFSIIGTPVTPISLDSIRRNVVISGVTPLSPAQIGIGAGQTIGVFKVTNQNSFPVALTNISFSNGGSATSGMTYSLYASAQGGVQVDTSETYRTGVSNVSFGDITGISEARRTISGSSWRYLTMKTGTTASYKNTFQLGVGSEGNVKFSVKEVDVGVSLNPYEDSDLVDVFTAPTTGTPTLATLVSGDSTQTSTVNIMTLVGGTIVMANNCTSNLSGPSGSNTGSCSRAITNATPGTYFVQWYGGYPTGADTAKSPTITSSQTLTNGGSVTFYLDFVAAVSQPSLTVLSPNGGERFTNGEFLSYAVEVRGATKKGDMEIYLTERNTSDWSLGKRYFIGKGSGFDPAVINPIIDRGSVQLDSRYYPAGTYYLLAAWINQDGTGKTSDFSDAPFTITSSTPQTGTVNVVTRHGGRVISQSENGNCTSNLVTPPGNNTAGCVRTVTNAAVGTYSLQWYGGHPAVSGIDTTKPPTITPSQTLTSGGNLTFYLDFEYIPPPVTKTYTTVDRPTYIAPYGAAPICGDAPSMDKFCKDNGYEGGELGTAYSGGSCFKWTGAWALDSSTLYSAKCYRTAVGAGSAPVLTASFVEAMQGRLSEIAQKLRAILEQMR